MATYMGRGLKDILMYGTCSEHIRVPGHKEPQLQLPEEREGKDGAGENRRHFF